MVRQLYIILLALHPARFRYRFALEMLAIFDEAAAHGSALTLLADGIRSLVRQWVHPYRPVAAATAPAGAGTPVFHLLDTSPPNRHCLMTGVAFSLVLLSALTISIGRGGGSPGISNGGFDWMPGLFGVNRDSIEPSEATVEFSSGALDCDGDGMLSASEIANAPVVLRTLDRDKDGRLGPDETTSSILAVFDQDRDGIISSAEISRSTAVLRGLDANGDGTLVLKEVLAAVLAAKGP